MPCSSCSQNGHNIRTCPNLFAPSMIMEQPLIDNIPRIPVVSDDDTIEYLDVESFEHTDTPLSMADLVADPPTPVLLSCIICYEDIDGEKVSLKCGHDYCVQCFIKHMRVGNHCAYCRDEVCEPVTKNNKILTTNQICNIIETSIHEHPEFMETIHNDLLRQTKKFIEENYNNTTTRQKTQIAIMCKRAIANTDLSFGYWVAGIQMAESVAAYFTNDN